MHTRIELYKLYILRIYKLNLHQALLRKPVTYFTYIFNIYIKSILYI